MHQLAVIGEQQEPACVLVEASNGSQAGTTGGEAEREQLIDGWVCVALLVRNNARGDEG